MMFRILLDLLTMCGKIKKYAPKWWFFMVFCHGPKQKNTLSKSKILELPKIRFPEDVHPFNTNLAKSVLYLAPKQLHGPPGGDGKHPRESQGNVSTSKLMMAFIGRFICFICGKILEQGVKGTKIRQRLCTNLCKKTPSNQMSQVKSHFHHSHIDSIKLATNL